MSDEKKVEDFILPTKPTKSKLKNPSPLLVFGKPKIGKTTAINQAFNELEQELETSEDDCLLFKLGDFESKQDLLNGIFQSDKFTKWLNGNYKLHLF